MKSRFRIITMLLFVTLVGIFISCEDNSVNTPTEQTYTGTVLDADDMPVPQATVQAVNDSNTVISSDVTDSLGNFKLSKLPKNFEELYLQISHPDYAVFKDKIKNIEESLKGKSDKKRDILLSKKDSCCGKIAVQVLDSNGNTAIHGVSIRITQEGSIMDTALTDQQGIAYFNHYCNGQYAIRVAYEGYKVKEEHFSVTGCDTLNLVYKLVKHQDSCCKGKLVINLKDQNGNFLEGAKFLIKNGDTYDIPNGKLTLDICEGSYSGWIKKDGYKTLEFSFTIPCNQTLELNKTILKDSSACCGVIAVKVTDQNSNVLTGKEVALRKGSDNVATVKTGDHGIAYFSHICNDNYNIRIALDNYQVFEYSFSFQSDCDTLSITAKLTPKQNGDSCCKGILFLEALNSDGKLVGSSTLNLTKDGKTNTIQSTNGDFFAMICEGHYSAKLTKDGYKALEFAVDIVCKDTTTIQKTMQMDSTACCGVIKIVVRDETQKPIQNARVALGKGNSTLSDPRTNGDGVVTFYHICSGDYWLNISAEHYETKEEDFTVKGNCDSTLINITLKAIPTDTCCHGILKLTVFNSKNNEKLANASVTLSKNGQTVETVKTNGDGYCAIDGICTGTYSVKITRDGFESLTYNVEFNCNETKTFEKGLTPVQQVCCGQFYAYVYDKNAKTAIANADIKLTDANGNVINLKSDNNGNAQKYELCPSKYSVRISKNGYSVYESSFTIVHCDTGVAEAGLASNSDCCNSKIKFTVKEGDDLSQNATIKIYQGSTLLSTLKTTNGVAETDAKFCKGNYSASISKDGYNAVEFTFSITECGSSLSFEKTITKKQSCCDRVVKFVAMNEDSTEAINGVKFIAYMNGNIVAQATTENGNPAVLENLCDGVYTFKAIKDGLVTEEMHETLNCNTKLYWLLRKMKKN